jgi:hypothetical protein
MKDEADPKAGLVVVPSEDGVQRKPEVPLLELVSLMELTRIELATSGLQSRRSPI